MVFRVQDYPSPTCFLDDLDSELYLSLPKNPKNSVQRFCWGDEKLKSS